jgi:hypothetical protein
MDIKASDFDLVKSDKKTIDCQKVLLKMWEYRKNKHMITQLATILSKFVDEKRVFADMEYFLSQIAHLTIHLEKNQALEALLVHIAQQSMHTALQLAFIFTAAMEDFQPETLSGHVNPTNNHFLFHRCSRLLEDVERAVIYGSHTVTTQERDILGRKASGSDATIKDLKREETASALSRMKSFMEGQLSGDLFYKRLERKSALHTKQWKTRYFIVDKRVLSCYHDPFAVTPIRAMHLQNARVIEHENHAKYGDTVFEVINDSTGQRFLLRAESPTSRRSWINTLQRYVSLVSLPSCTLTLSIYLISFRSQINGAPPVIVEIEKVLQENEEPGSANQRRITPAISQSDMTPIQRKR